jgi:two-component system, NarL family, response regulator NreC
MRIVVIAGEPAFRLGIGMAVGRTEDIQLAAEAGDARSGFAAVDSADPDVVLIDVNLRGMDGIDATREVRRRSPRARVLLLSSWPRERDVLDGLAAGASGYALKTDPIESLHDAIRAVAAGQRYLAPGLRRWSQDARPNHHANGSSDVLRALSLREREVLSLVVKGRRSRDIAAELCISIKTVETHRNHINRKLGCTSAADLTRFAADNGLLRTVPEAPEQRVLMVVVDEGARAELVQEAESRGYQCGRSSSASLALAEVRAAESPALRVVDGGGGPDRVRAVVSVPSADAARWLLGGIEHPESVPPGLLSLSSS